MARGRTRIGWLVERIYGRDGEHETLYLWRLKLLRTPWCGLMLHVFHRGDADPDPHDHPWDFWTFPLTTYSEEVQDPGTGALRYERVRAFQIHRRNRLHTHRVLGDILGRKIVTLVWHGPPKRKWGFWVRGPEARQAVLFDRDAVLASQIMSRIRGEYTFVPWRRYIYGDD